MFSYYNAICLRSTLSSIRFVSHGTTWFNRREKRYYRDHHRISFSRFYVTDSDFPRTADRYTRQTPFPVAVRVCRFHYLRERSCSADSNYRGSRKTCLSPASAVDPVDTCGVDNPRIYNRHRSRSARCPRDSRRRFLLETEKLPARLTSGIAIPRETNSDMSDRRTAPLKRSKDEGNILRMLDIFFLNCSKLRKVFFI